MAAPITIALDAMGGDFGASIVVPGAAIALERRPDIRFILHGDENIIAPLLVNHPALRAVAEIRHTDVFVKMDDKPSQALRAGRYKSSMWQAIEAVKNGDADVAVSAGNTGALMAMAMFCLKTMAPIDRPAIAGIWPTLRGESIVLDIGATIGADADQLVNLALMGAALARAVFDIERPSVGLLNVGVEEIKGNEAVKEAGRLLRESESRQFIYHGFVEGDDLGKGTVDVVVTEGFAGNIALKAAEGTARQIANYLRAAIERSFWARIGYLFARGAFNALKEKLDPRRSNGGIFLGLNGIVIKSHGGTDAYGFAAAVELAYDMSRFGLIDRIRDTLPRLQPVEATAE